jgi:hypothetical protein
MQGRACERVRIGWVYYITGKTKQLLSFIFSYIFLFPSLLYLPSCPAFSNSLSFACLKTASEGSIYFKTSNIALVSTPSDVDISTPVGVSWMRKSH